jgi:hypothetical protein
VYNENDGHKMRKLEAANVADVNQQHCSKTQSPPKPPLMERTRVSTTITPTQSIAELLRRGGGENLRNLVEGTIREILASDKTERCIEQERKRNEIKELSVFARGLREAIIIIIAS